MTSTHSLLEFQLYIVHQQRTAMFFIILQLTKVLCGLQILTLPTSLGLDAHNAWLTALAGSLGMKLEAQI